MSFHKIKPQNQLQRAQIVPLFIPHTQIVYTANPERVRVTERERIIQSENKNKRKRISKNKKSRALSKVNFFIISQRRMSPFRFPFSEEKT